MNSKTEREKKFLELLDKTRDVKDFEYYFDFIEKENIVRISSIESYSEKIECDDIQIIFDLNKFQISYIDFGINYFGDSIIDLITEKDKKNFINFYNKIENIIKKIINEIDNFK